MYLQSVPANGNCQSQRIKSLIKMKLVKLFSEKSCVSFPMISCDYTHTLDRD